MYGYGYGFGRHAHRRVAGPVTTPSATIALPASVWAFGSSSIAGAQQATTGSGGTEDAFTSVVRAIEALPRGSLAYTTVSGSQTTRPIDYNLTGVNAAHKVRNRGVGGQTAGSGGTIVATMTAAAAGFGAPDFLFLHQGDNGISHPSATTELWAGGYSAMRTQAGARPFIQIINTRATGDFAGGYASFAKDANYRVQCDLFPGRVVDFHQTMAERATPADANDTADLLNGQPPRSYLMNDGSHQIAKGYNLQSDAWATPVIDAWAGGTPFPVRQIVESVQPAVPAAGDVIGSIVAYGSGGSFSLDASNNQTDYAISSSGQITRIGATPPARDITWMAVKCSKSGRFDKVQPRIGVCERAAPGVSKLVEFDGFSVIGMPDTKLTNSAKLTILCRLQATQATTQEVFAGTNQITVRMSGGALTVVIRNSANVVIFDKTTANTLFRTTDPPRWMAACLDLTDPAAEITKLITWIDPASATSDAAVLAALTADATTAHLARLDQTLALGYSGGAAPQIATFKKFRVGDLFLWRDYIDFGVQARRAEVCDASGIPLSAWVAGDGVTDGKTPNIGFQGNAGDFRQCRIKGSGKPATPGASGQYFGFSFKESSAGNPGNLVTV